MSDARPEIRPLTFPRPAEAAPAAAFPAAPSDHRHDARLDADELADGTELDDADADDLEIAYAGGMAGHEDPAIAGRIGAPPAADAPGELVEMLLRLGQRLRGHLDGRFGVFGLSDARFAALSVIRESSPAGCTQAHLAARLGQCESSISTLVERMRASRLLYRLRAKADRRKRVLMLTDDGRRLLEQGLACRDREADALFNRMTAEDREALASMLGRLYASLDRVGPAHGHAERPAA